MPFDVTSGGEGFLRGIPAKTAALETRKRQVLVVLGMHRSGTSSLTGVLAMRGATPPKTLMPANEGNVRGYWESLEVVRLNDEILASVGSTWSDWRPISRDWYQSSSAAQFAIRAQQVLRDEYGDSPLFVLKDPRICRLIPFWFDALKALGVEPRVVVPIRSPLEVAYSVRKVHGHSISHGLLLWLHHTLEVELQTREHKRAIVLWSDFLKDPHLAIHKISKQLGIPLPATSDTIARRIDLFLSSQLRKFTVEDADFHIHPNVHVWVKKVYKAMCSLAAGQRGDRAQNDLSAIRNQFNLAGSLFGMTLAEF